jgi:alanine-glyoxylate transaminase/serine-glyoxylate transaminase/serine-pyruvate transaminase
MELPSRPRLLLGPGPSPVSPRVLAALSAAPRSHLDGDLLALLDAIRARLTDVFRTTTASRVLAVSGTGTAAMEAAVANVTEPGRSALVIVTGYFGERLADMLARYGAAVRRVDVEWGRAVDPDDVRRALDEHDVDLVAIVHAETSTGVLNPVREIAALAAQRGALTIADTVTSLGAMPVEMDAWGVDVCYACSQKGLGAPPGLSPIAFSPRALDRRVACRSFYFDLDLLERYWVERQYHHTISAPLVYALHAALEDVEDEGLEARWQRHARVHVALVDELRPLDMTLLPPPGERLWCLNAVQVPPGVDEAAVRRRLLEHDDIEIGAGLAALAGRVWRIGLMGAGATEANVTRVTAALAEAIRETPAVASGPR